MIYKGIKSMLHGLWARITLTLLIAAIVVVSGNGKNYKIDVSPTKYHTYDRIVFVHINTVSHGGNWGPSRTESRYIYLWIYKLTPIISPYGVTTGSEWKWRHEKQYAQEWPEVTYDGDTHTYKYSIYTPHIVHQDDCYGYTCECGDPECGDNCCTSDCEIVIATTNYESKDLRQVAFTIDETKMLKGRRVFPNPFPTPMPE